MDSVFNDNRRTRPITVAAWTGAVTGVAGLILSGIALISTIDDDDRQREVEARLVCLELPGPNDCGLDGR